MVGNLAQGRVEVTETCHTRSAVPATGEKRQLIIQSCKPEWLSILLKTNGLIAIGPDTGAQER